MRKRIVLFFMVGILFVWLAGACSKRMLENAPRPQVELGSVELADLTLQSVTLQWDVTVSNPYMVSLPVTNLRYELLNQEKTFLSGDIESQDPVPAGGSSVIPVPVRISFAELLSQLGRVKPGAVIPYTGRITVKLEPPVLGPISVTRETRAEFPVPAIPRVTLGQLQWDTLSWSEAVARLEIDLFNPNQFPVDLQSFSYGIQLGDYEVATNQLERSLTLSSNDSEVLPLEFRFSPLQFGMGLFQMMRGESSVVSLTGNMRVETRFGSLEIPFEKIASVPMVNR